MYSNGGGYFKLNINNSHLEAKTSGNTQVVNIGSVHENHVEINIMDTSIDAGTSGYAIDLWNPAILNVQNSKVQGYANIFLRDQGDNDSSNSKVNVTNSQLISVNPHTAESYSSFAAFPIDSSNNEIVFNNVSVTNEASNSATQAFFSLYGANNNKITISGENTNFNFIGNEDLSYFYEEGESSNNVVTITNGTFNRDITQYVPDGYEAMMQGEEIYKVGKHDLVITEAKAPTCLEKGNIQYSYCDFCKRYFNEKGEEITIEETILEALGHQAKKVEAVEPTVQTEGNITYWYCEACDQYFGDEALTNKITKEDTILPKLEEGDYEVKAPTIDSTKPVEKVTVGIKVDKQTEAILTQSMAKATLDKIDECLDKGIDVVSEVSIHLIDLDEASKYTKEQVNKMNLVAKENSLEMVEYFDISIYVLAKDYQIEQISKTVQPLTFQMALPEDLMKEGREFYVVRIHEGKVDVLPTSRNENLLSFNSDKFSIYALAYKDSTALVPNTSDSSSLSLYLASTTFSLLSIACVVLYKKKEERI